MSITAALEQMKEVEEEVGEGVPHKNVDHGVIADRRTSTNRKDDRTFDFVIRWRTYRLWYTCRFPIRPS